METSQCLLCHTTYKCPLKVNTQTCQLIAGELNNKKQLFGTTRENPYLKFVDSTQEGKVERMKLVLEFMSWGTNVLEKFYNWVHFK